MTPNKYKAYKLYAQNYKARLLMTNKKAIVHLESFNDISFWKKVLRWGLPFDDFEFISFTRTLSGSKGTGCQQCLVYKDFLDSRMVIAIDSDFRYLLQEPDMDAAHYILQTYTHSFENHLCFGDRLNLLIDKVCGLNNDLFDFNDFLLQYSTTVYPLLLMYLYDKRQPERRLPDTDFFKVLTFPHNTTWLANNGACIIEELYNRIEAETKRLKSVYTTYEYEKERQRYLSLGLHEENAYLYVRGHNLYNLIAEIGESLCSLLRKREKERLIGIGQYENAIAVYAKTKTFKQELCKGTLLYAYPEINKIFYDIQSIWT